MPLLFPSFFWYAPHVSGGGGGAPSSFAWEWERTSAKTVCVVPAMYSGAAVAIMSDRPDAARIFSSSVSSFVGASLYMVGRSCFTNPRHFILSFLYDWATSNDVPLSDVA